VAADEMMFEQLVTLTLLKPKFKTLSPSVLGQLSI